MKKAPLHLALAILAGFLVAIGASAQPIGVIDEPTAGQQVSGVVRVSGFVLDFNKVDKIELFIDGSSTPTNTADLNIPRIDVLNAFPNYVNSATPRPGFLTSFYTRTLSNGTHSVTVRVTESSGDRFTLGPVSVIVDNTVNQAPFGYIDMPSDTGTEGMNGSYPIVGWALDDQGIDHIDFLIAGETPRVRGRAASGRKRLSTERPAPTSPPRFPTSLSPCSPASSPTSTRRSS